MAHKAKKAKGSDAPESGKKKPSEERTTPPKPKKLKNLTPAEEKALKPKHAPRIDKWRENGGDVDFYDDGTVVYTRSDGASLPYRDGYPVFRDGRRADGSPMVIKEVEIEQQGNHGSDFADANEAAGFKPTQQGHPDGTVWHHHEDQKTMQLIHDEDHTASQGGFSHQGGVSKSKQ